MNNSISISVRWGHKVREAAPGEDQGGLPGDGDDQHVAVVAGLHHLLPAPAPGCRGFSLS